MICVEIGGALVGPGPVAGGRRDDDEGEGLGKPAPHAGRGNLRIFDTTE